MIFESEALPKAELLTVLVACPNKNAGGGAEEEGVLLNIVLLLLLLPPRETLGTGVIEEVLLRKVNGSFAGAGSKT